MIIVLISGTCFNIPVEILDTNIEEAKQIAERMLPHIKNITWAADGIMLSVSNNGFIKEEWLITLENEYEKLGWIKLSGNDEVKNWKKLRELKNGN
jgi:hypothetical protein